MCTITIIFALWALCYGTKTANICTKQRCDFLKALLPFFIILHHHAKDIDWPWPFSVDFNALGARVVMMFFFISGYGLEYKRSSKGILLAELPARLKKLFTPTLLPIALYVSMLLIVGPREELWATITGCWYPLPHSWFVVVLAILYVGFYICAWLTKGKKSFLVLLFCYSVATVVSLEILNAPTYMIISDLSIFVGALYKQYEYRLLELMKAQWIRVTVALFSIAFVLVYMYCHDELPKILKPSYYLWLVLIFAMFAYMKVFQNKTFDFLTKISYDVYLCQCIAFGIVPYEKMNYALSFLAICILTVIIATFSHWAHGLLFKR